MMEYINFENLLLRSEELRHLYQNKKPFRYIKFDNFFRDRVAKAVYEGFPAISDGQWDGTTYLDQKNKFQKNNFENESIFRKVFAELNSPQFIQWLEQLTGITELTGDEELFGGGLHQSINGAFLNVHVDYNIHPKSKMHRRLNVLVYMNPDWKEDYGGHLELWDIKEGKKKLLESFAPGYNSCVIFETNEHSFHGHPRPLKTPPGVNRKSIATYYYTRQRPQEEITNEHNTIYVNTEGTKGITKRIGSGVKAAIERLFKK